MRIPKWQIETDIELFRDLSMEDLIKCIALCHRLKTILPDYVQALKEAELQIKVLEEQLNADKNNS